MSGDNCETMFVPAGGINKIQASYSDDNNSITAIKFYKEDGAKTFGDLDNSYEEWTFSQGDRLMGIKGYLISQYKITQLSFITYAASCPSYSIVESYNWVDPNCFMANSVKVGASSKISLTNEDELESTDFYSDMRLKQISGCKSPSHELVANMQFILQSTDSSAVRSLMLTRLGPDVPGQECWTFILEDDEKVASMEISYTSNYIEYVVIILNSGRYSKWGEQIYG